jgi:hypothetical protein
MADRYLAKIAATVDAPEARDAEDMKSIETRVPEFHTVPDTDSVPDEDTYSDDFWIPEDWQEDWEERAAIMEQDGGLPVEQVQTEAAISVVRVKHPQGELAASWLSEVWDVRQGRAPEWESWTAACRANWAGQMIQMAIDRDFLKLAGKRVRAWLEGLVQAQPSSQQVSRGAEPFGERQDGGRSPPANAYHACFHCGAH